MFKNIFKMTRARLVLDIFLLGCLLAIACAFASVIWMPGSSYRGAILPFANDEQDIEKHLRSYENKLAVEIGQRNSVESLQKSIQYIEDTLKSFGYEIEEQDFTVDGHNFKNISAELTGVSEPKQILLIGAHYDSVNGSPGANDNGSGVSSVLEIARQNAGKKNAKTLRFVFFTNEEPPYFSSKEMGSYFYAKQCAERNENIIGLLVMETLGYYTDQPNSQTYPASFVPGYPSTGNFVAFVGNQDSRLLVESCVGTFRAECKFPSEGVSAPNWVNGVDWSDQYWFWRNGYRALMITDTALYRYQYYHTLQDTPDKMNFPSFARVVSGLTKVVGKLVN
ncbi:MAG: M28 family peptidase [Candidatus Obscuribacterales bacterium]|nr:M28 family peptidase [Candidatus Obscuribacterales bacterium]